MGEIGAPLASGMPRADAGSRGPGETRAQALGSRSSARPDTGMPACSAALVTSRAPIRAQLSAVSLMRVLLNRRLQVDRRSANVAGYSGFLDQHGDELLGVLAANRATDPQHCHVGQQTRACASGSQIAVPLTAGMIEAFIDRGDRSGSACSAREVNFSLCFRPALAPGRVVPRECRRTTITVRYPAQTQGFEPSIRLRSISRFGKPPPLAGRNPAAWRARVGHHPPIYPSALPGACARCHAPTRHLQISTWLPARR